MCVRVRTQYKTKIIFKRKEAKAEEKDEAMRKTGTVIIINEMKTTTTTATKQ